MAERYGIEIRKLGERNGQSRVLAYEFRIGWSPIDEEAGTDDGNERLLSKDLNRRERD